MFNRKMSGKRVNLTLRSVAWLKSFPIRGIYFGLDGTVSALRTLAKYASLLRTICWGKKAHNFFSKFNTLSTDTPLIQTLSIPLSESVLKGCDCTHPPSLLHPCHYQDDILNRCMICFVVLVILLKWWMYELHIFEVRDEEIYAAKIITIEYATSVSEAL